MGVTAAVAETEAERERVYQFRYRVYVEEMGLSPPGADHERKRLYEPLDAVSITYALLADGQVVGSMRATLLDAVDDPAPLIEKFQMGPAIDAVGRSAICTTSRFMLDSKRRHGTAVFRLVERAIEDAHRLGRRLNYGDCSPHMLPLYEHLGFRRYGRTYNDTHFGFKIPILMLVGDHAWFQRVRSPLARVATRYADDAGARAWFERTYPECLAIESAALLPDGVFFDLLCDRVASDPLHQVGLLRGLSREEAQLFLGEATLIKAAPNDRFVRQGEPGDALFMLLSGVAEVVTDEVPDVPLAVLGAGDSFGEMGFLTLKPRTATVIARAPCEVLVLSGDFLQRFTEKQTAIAAKVLLNLARMLAERLTETSRRAVNAP